MLRRPWAKGLGRFVLLLLQTHEPGFERGHGMLDVISCYSAVVLYFGGILDYLCQVLFVRLLIAEFN